MEAIEKERLIDIEINRIEGLQRQLDNIDSIAETLKWNVKQKTQAMHHWKSKISKAQNVIQEVETSY